MNREQMKVKVKCTTYKMAYRFSVAQSKLVQIYLVLSCLVLYKNAWDGYRRTVRHASHLIT